MNLNNQNEATELNAIDMNNTSSNMNINNGFIKLKAAINSPLLENSIDGASGIIMNVTGGPDMTLFEVTDAAQVIHDAVSGRTPCSRVVCKGTRVDADSLRRIAAVADEASPFHCLGMGGERNVLVPAILLHGSI